MTEPYVGEIQMFGFNFNPRGWAFCNGAMIVIQQNTALFALLGTTYGGNGQTTFQLPNFGARAGCEQGHGPGLTPRNLGQIYGVNTVTLASNQIPAHNHIITGFLPSVSSNRSGSPIANGGLSQPLLLTNKTFSSGAPNTTLAPNMIQPNSGGSLPHQNQQPYLGVNFCIALQGIFPSFT